MQFSSTQLTQLLAFSQTSIKPSSSCTYPTSIGEEPETDWCSVNSDRNVLDRHDRKNSASSRIDLNDGDDLAICV